MAERIFSSESVTEGHPDKLADRISDSFLDELLRQDPESRVAVETLVSTGLVHVAGEVTTNGYGDPQRIVRDVLEEVGYGDPRFGFAADSLGIINSIGQQSAEIADGVSRSLESRVGLGNDELSVQGAGDQGIMFGFACDETPELFPLSAWLAHRLTKRLATVRKTGAIAELGPDGKAQVSVKYRDGKPERVDSVVVSTQHLPAITQRALRAAVSDTVVKPVLEEAGFTAQNLELLINPAGPFVHGGPAADAGLTGRKIIIDTYGGAARHGGGAFSGKDASKVDRSAAYAMRWVAKHVVRAGLANRCELQVAYAIGKAHPVSVFLETFDTHTLAPERIEKAVREVFDLRPLAIIRQLRLLRPIYAKTSAYGHFGREDAGFTWEETPRIDELLAAAGL